MAFAIVSVMNLFLVNIMIYKVIIKKKKCKFYHRANFFWYILVNQYVYIYTPKCE